jgi:hypothetical protein
MKDFASLVSKLEKEKNFSQARIIKNFAAHIYSRHSGEGVELDIVDNLDDIFDKATKG